MRKAKYHCPVEVTLEAIGGKWRCVILWWLRQESKRFSELKELIPGISQKILTQQLRELETHGLIRRDVYQEKPPRVEYSLTPLGESVRPITDLMCEWGKKRMPGYEFDYMKNADTF
jgi:DNA-binding HxlR family transcriptional regulator